MPGRKKSTKKEIKAIYVGADHAGYRLKKSLIPYLRKLGYKVIDKGAKKLMPKDDYPDYALPVAREVAQERGWGILVCGSAQGVGIVANKVKGVRAAVINSSREARLAREHNDANILCLSSWDTPFPRARAIARTFLSTGFSGAARHKRRLKKLARIESRTMK